MRVFYFQSGYKGIYLFIDQWINEAAINNKVDFQTFSPMMKPSELTTIIQTRKPDFVLMNIANKIPFSLIKTIKDNNIPLAVWLTEDPFYTDSSLQVLPLADYILTIDEGAAHYYRTLGYRNVYILPLGTSEETFKPLNVKKDDDLLIVGYPYPGRVAIVDQIFNSTNYSIRLIGDKWRKFLTAKQKKSRKLDIIDRWIAPSEVNLYYNKAKIILNPHREYNFNLNKNARRIHNKSVNNRFYDIFSSGGFQLFEQNIKLPEHFPLLSQIQYSGPNDCVKKINHFMQSPSLLQEIAAIGQQTTRQHHTYTHRIEQLINVITNPSAN